MILKEDKKALSFWLKDLANLNKNLIEFKEYLKICFGKI
jgi:hypothetical protein